MVAINQQALALMLKVFGGNCIPPEGPQAIPIVLDFTATRQELEANLVITQQQHKISYIQSIYVDNSINAEPLEIFIPSTQHLVTVPPYHQGFIALLCSNPPSIIFASAVAAPINVVVQLLNFPVSNIIWNTDPTFSASGGLTVTDPVLDALLGGGFLPTLAQGLRSTNLITALPIADNSVSISKANTGNTDVIAAPGAGAYLWIESLQIHLTSDVSLAAPGQYDLSVRNGNAGQRVCSLNTYIGAASTVPDTYPQIIMPVRRFLSANTALIANANVALATGSVYVTANYATITL